MNLQRWKHRLLAAWIITATYQVAVNIRLAGIGWMRDRFTGVNAPLSQLAGASCAGRTMLLPYLLRAAEGLVVTDSDRVKTSPVAHGAGYLVRVGDGVALFLAGRLGPARGGIRNDRSGILHARASRHALAGFDTAGHAKRAQAARAVT